jgi:membrane-associated phospholipid phosphatase
LTLAFAGALWIDTLVTENRNAEAIPGDLQRIIHLSEIFAHGWGAILVLLLVWRLAPHLKHRLGALAACLLLPGLAAQGIKLMVARRRPLSYSEDVPPSPESILHLPSTIAETWLGVFPDAETGSEYAFQSFPSAHAAGAVAMAIGLSWVFPRGKVIFIGLALLASFQRIESGAHWLSDVIAGAAVAVAVCFGILSWQRRREVNRLASRPVPRRELDPLTLRSGNAQKAA